MSLPKILIDRYQDRPLWYSVQADSLLRAYPPGTSKLSISGRISRHKITSIAAYPNLIFNKIKISFQLLKNQLLDCYLHDLTLALSLVTTGFLFSEQGEKKVSTRGDQLAGQVSSSAKTDVKQQGVDKLEKVQQWSTRLRMLLK